MLRELVRSTLSAVQSTESKRKKMPRPKGTKVTPAHKKAMKEGRRRKAVVDRYIDAVNKPGRRGRKVTKAELERRLRKAEEELDAATGADRVLTAQRIRDLEARLDEKTETVDLAGLERDFVKVAKAYGESKDLSYGAWRDAGVPPEVLKKAGIPRTRG